MEMRSALIAYGGFLLGQQAARHMLPRGAGAILFSRASASVKGYPLSAPSGRFTGTGASQDISDEGNRSQ